ncbi:MAG: PHP domain-containing protein, partial [Clostridiales bacterium]|nr:PHP domain-containing protein [Clostridiales bacterium]
MFADYHVHTSYSDDSDYLPEDVIKDALKMNMDEICITDHVDFRVKANPDDEDVIRYRDGNIFAGRDYSEYVSEIERVQNLYKNKINIKFGAEYGMQLHTISHFEKLFGRYPLD